MAIPYENTIINLAYHSTVIVTFDYLYSMLLKSLFKMKPIELGRTDLLDLSKLTAVTAMSMMTSQYLIKQKIIPADINI